MKMECNNGPPNPTRACALKIRFIIGILIRQIGWLLAVYRVIQVHDVIVRIVTCNKKN